MGSEMCIRDRAAAASPDSVEVVLPAVNLADVSASTDGGAVDPPASALHGDAVPDAADASPVGPAFPPPAASVQDVSALASGGAVAPSAVELAASAGPGPLSVSDLLGKANLGKYVVYMATPSSELPGRLEEPGRAFAVVGRIRQVVWEDKRVWFDTEDNVASEDQHYPNTLVDGKWTVSYTHLTLPTICSV